MLAKVDRDLELDFIREFAWVGIYSMGRKSTIAVSGFG